MNKVKLIKKFDANPYMLSALHDCLRGKSDSYVVVATVSPSIHINVGNDPDILTSASENIDIVRWNYKLRGDTAMYWDNNTIVVVIVDNTGILNTNKLYLLNRFQHIWKEIYSRLGIKTYPSDNDILYRDSHQKLSAFGIDFNKATSVVGSILYGTDYSDKDKYFDYTKYTNKQYPSQRNASILKISPGMTKEQVVVSALQSISDNLDISFVDCDIGTIDDVDAFYQKHIDDSWIKYENNK